MAQQAVDYDALAKQFGAIPAGVDYDALAKQNGALSSAPPIVPDARSASQVLKDTILHPIAELSKPRVISEGVSKYMDALFPKPDPMLKTGMSDPAVALIGAAVPGGPMSEGLGLKDAMIASPLGRLIAGAGPKTTAEDLLTKAAANRTKTSPPSSIDIPTSTIGGVKQVVSRASGPIRNARAALQERLAQIATAGDVSPNLAAIASAPETSGALDIPSSANEARLKAAAYVPAADTSTSESRLAQTAREDAARTVAQPMKPSIFDQDNQRWLDAQRGSMMPELDMKPPVPPSEPLPFNGTITSSAAKPDMEAIERAIAPSGKYAKKAAQMINADGTPTAYGTKLVTEVPELAGAKTQANATKALTSGFQRAQQGVIQAENAIPDAAVVDKEPIVQGFRDLAKEYEQFANPKTSAALDKLVSTWSDKPAQIPWDDFLKSKRAFFDEANVSSAPMRRAYGILMDASSKVSQDLSDANQSYATVRRALDNAGIDVRTGRRIADVGKTARDTFKSRLDSALPKP